MASFLCIIPLLNLSQCMITSEVGGRELRPPTQGIEVGSLYYVREKPAQDISKPAYLERLCSVNLQKYNVVPKENQRVADIDLLSKIDLDGSLDGLKTGLAEAGLTGSLGNYYEYKLTNVSRTDISWVEAQNIFDNRAFRKDCADWQSNIKKQNWSVYQIRSITLGDISFSRKTDGAADATISVKLAALEPKIKAAIKKTTQTDMSGKGLIVSFDPISRNDP